MTQILDGKALSTLIRAELKVAIDKLPTPPGLGVILVGEGEASRAYVANKERAAKACGFHTVQKNFPSSIGESTLLEEIKRMNEDPTLHGILLQLPLPEHIDAAKAIHAISPLKDADGLHPLNQGYLLRGEALRYNAPLSCTPLGVIKLLNYHLTGLHHKACDLKGKHAVVIGRSTLVGKPVAQLLLNHDATVTMAHSRTQNLPALCRQADITVAAVGIEGLVKEDFIKEQSIVIDVGINRNSAGKLVGDVAFNEVMQAGKAAAITPVPGGVGPLTVAMLLSNTYDLFTLSR